MAINGEIEKSMQNHVILPEISGQAIKLNHLRYQTGPELRMRSKILLVGRSAF